MRVLWVTDEVPHLTRGGGGLRQYQLLRRLAPRAEIDLLIAGRLEDSSLRRALNAVVEVDAPLPAPPWLQAARRGLAAVPSVPPAEVAFGAPTAARLRRKMSEMGAYDVVNVEHEWLAETAGRTGNGSPMTITLHNLLSARLAQTAAVAAPASRRVRLRAAAANALRYERTLDRRYRTVITVSEEDAGRLGRRAAVVPNGVDLEAFAFSEPPPCPRMIITATWSWAPNAEGAVWAAQELLPRVRDQVPGAELVLVGRQPPAAVRALTQRAGVSGHFDVPDVEPFLRQARVALVPLQVGSGTRLKALEAMAAGRPLVGTPIGLEGLGLVDGVTAHFAASAEEMARRVVSLFSDDDHARDMAAAARRRAEERFGWDQAADALLAVLRSCAGDV